MTNLRKLMMVLAVVPVLMAAKCNPGAISACPSDVQHSDAFWDAVYAELRIVAPQAPNVVQLLGEYDISMQQIRHCIRQQKKKR